MRFVGNHEIKIRRRKTLLIFVVEQQRLDGGDNDLRLSPVVASFLVHNRPEVYRQQRCEHLGGLIFQFQPVDEKKHATDVTGTQKQFDDRGGRERLARARGHFEEEPVAAVLHRPLQRMNGRELIRTQQS